MTVRNKNCSINDPVPRSEKRVLCHVTNLLILTLTLTLILTLILILTSTLALTLTVILTITLTFTLILSLFPIVFSIIKQNLLIGLDSSRYVVLSRKVASSGEFRRTRVKCNANVSQHEFFYKSDERQ